MRKRRIIILAACIAVLGLVWWAAAGKRPDPVYGGHPLSFWLKPYRDSKGNYLNMAVVPSLDSNAVPYLVQALKTSDGTLRVAYEHLWPRFPLWLKRRVPGPTSEEAEEATRWSCVYLSNMGTKARPAIPDLVRLLRGDTERRTRMGVVDALGFIANGQDKQVVEALLAAATKDTDASVRSYASFVLSKFDAEAAAKAGVTNAAPPGWVPTINSAGAVP